MFTAFRAMIIKELRQTFRDKRMIMVLMAAPLVQLILMGYAVDLDVDRIATAVFDQDRTPESQHFVRGLLADGTLVRATQPGIALELPLRDSTAHAVVVIPRGFGTRLTHGRPTQVQFLIDGTDTLRAQVLESTAQQYTARYAARILREGQAQRGQLSAASGGLPGISVIPRVLYNPRLKSSVYMVPGVAAMVLLVVTTIVTAMGLAREREIGTIEQLLITPIKPVILLLGKIIPFAAIGLVVAGLVIAIGTRIFHIPIRGSLGLVLVGTILYLLTTLGMGVLISTMARTQQQAILGGFFVMLPCILLSGFMSPVESMPWWIKPIAYCNPVTHYVLILRSALLKGAGWIDLAPNLAALLGFGFVIVSIATLRFYRKIA